MSTTKESLLDRTWTRNKFLISTNHTLISIPELNAIFVTDLVYWATPLPTSAMREMLSNSLCFGLYDTEAKSPKEDSPKTAMKLVGFARCVTDFATFSYLTDVFVLPAYQSEGLGSWLVGCVGEVHDGMPWLRRSMLFSGDWERSVPFYERVLGMQVINRGGEEEGKRPAVMQKMGPGFPGKYKEKGSV
ncbi:hypothetical protein E8E13_011023 [Curvularia kusanoi]|uniref:N-acetyltransferase domain-containing protein n=1 Tax=Curvularia kusanoi TaxID=90978 RepID=A0A9P4TMI7_CURKU|nr:hypothetical protein E8E13_011023 [Curvularia kusanoi]